MFRPREGLGKFHYYECKAVPEGNHSKAGEREKRCCVVENKMQDETWQTAVRADLETNHQHCFYETSLAVVMVTQSLPSGSRLTFADVDLKYQESAKRPTSHPCTNISHASWRGLAHACLFLSFFPQQNQSGPVGSILRCPDMGSSGEDAHQRDG